VEVDLIQAYFLDMERHERRVGIGRVLLYLHPKQRMVWPHFTIQGLSKSADGEQQY